MTQSPKGWNGNTNAGAPAVDQAMKDLEAFTFGLQDVNLAHIYERLRDALRVSSRSPEEWRCFHCDEVFTNEAEAREHFGAEMYRDAACRLPDGADIKHIRGLEARVSELQRDYDHVENDARLWYESEADRVRRIGNHQWWFEMDCREGEKLVLQERVKELEALSASRSLETETQTPEVIERLARSFAMEYLTAHFRGLREGEQKRYDQLVVVMLAFASQVTRLASRASAPTAEQEPIRHRGDLVRLVKRLRAFEHLDDAVNVAASAFKDTVTATKAAVSSPSPADKVNE